MELNLRNSGGDSLCLPTLDPSVASEIQQDTRVTQAVIIAAGNGSRLQSYKRCPKPLVKVGGIPLLKRVILAAKQAGVTDFVIVLGYQAARIRKSINARDLGVRITWVRNLDWRKPNGLSVLKAEKYIHGKFFLFMSDHVFDPTILERLKPVQLGNNCGALCVDYRLDRVPNLDDATKVRTQGGRLIDLGKSLADFNAIDAGIFLCTPALFEALRISQANGEYALSDGVRVLAKEGKMCTVDIGDAYWQDVDTEPDLRHAERLLLQATRSKGDGLIAKTINRRISNLITRWLMKTPITPNQISAFNLLFSAFAAWVVSFGQPISTIVGGILFQFASILDGCDGEVAHIKFKASKKGAFIDTVTDQLSYMFFVVGVTVGAYKVTGSPTVFGVAALALVCLLVALNFGRLYIKRQGSASLRELDKGIASLNEHSKPWYLRAFGVVHHFGRRDMFSFVAMLLLLGGELTAFFWLLMVGLFLISLAISVSAIFMLSADEFSWVHRIKGWVSRTFGRTPVTPVELEAE